MSPIFDSIRNKALEKDASGPIDLIVDEQEDDQINFRKLIISNIEKLHKKQKTSK